MGDLLNLFWLLLPVAAMSGWFAARRGSERASGKRVSKLSTSYFRGLNYLLNEEPDKAIEVFLKLADGDTVETHLALGNLFRRRGEVERAIRFHQNLITRPKLSAEQRADALLELGQDYMRAGLLDRAEALFGELVNIGAREPDALRQLVRIYQQEKDWPQAVAFAERLADIEGEAVAVEVAQYHCELAAVAMRDERLAEAQEHLADALRRDPGCVRASIMLGKLAERQGKLANALTAWRRVAEQDPDYLPEVIPLALRVYDQLDQSPRPWLQEIMQIHDGVAPVLALADRVRADEGDDAAVAFLQDALRRRPSIRGLSYLVNLNLESSSGEARENLLILQSLIASMLRGVALYRCEQCGYGGRVPHWQCPSCKTWNAVKPISRLTLA